MGDFFLLQWESSSQGQSDIVARGPFLLAMFIPYFVAAVSIIVALIAAVRARRLDRSALRDFALAVGLVLAVGVVLYVDPTASALRVLSAARSSLGQRSGYVGFIVVDLILVAVALLLVARGLRRDQPAPA